MSVLYVVVPGAVAVVAIAIAAYVWAARRGQFDDLVTPAWRVLNDDAEGRAREEPGRSEAPDAAGAEPDTTRPETGAPRDGDSRVGR